MLTTFELVCYCGERVSYPVETLSEYPPGYHPQCLATVQPFYASWHDYAYNGARKPGKRLDTCARM